MALVVLTMGCSKKDLQQKELTMMVSEVTDNTAILNCTFTPMTAASYQVQIGEAVSEEYSKDMQLNIANLASGTKHTVVATIYDADHKQVGTTEVEFRTTGTPDNAIQKKIPQTIFSDALAITLNKYSEVANSISVIFSFAAKDGFSEYSASCDNGGEFSETGRFTESKTLTLSNLESGTEYTITATLYNTASGATRNVTKTFTKK